MTWADISLVLGIVLAVAGIAATVIYGRRALRPPQRQLRWSYESTRLFALQHVGLGRRIRVSVGDKEVRDPHLLLLTLSNVGRRDVDTDAFDKERPIVFKVVRETNTPEYSGYGKEPSEPVAMLGADYRYGSAQPSLEIEESKIKIAPELLKANERWAARLLTSGASEIYLSEEHLIDTTIFQLRRPSPPRIFRNPWWPTIGLALTGLLLGFLINELLHALRVV
ncbi:hypothetical protein [Fodinicola acaciae]|uniref:hypothetical protein n=1 Tax=Fodinicola acaciae TaxID=2681555 RepID=UPI0013D25C5B|nr:hypothetical protein [Fodinicola acaciae]